MEFKKQTRHSADRGKINVPERGSAKLPDASVPATPADSVSIPDDLASQRQSLGFDDIPVDNDDMEHVRFRDIFSAWITQAAKNSPLEKRLTKAKTKKARLHELKNDLKWAMQADLDEPVTPQVPHRQPSHQKSTKEHSDKKHEPQSETKTIDININFGSLPKLPWLKTFFTKLSHSGIKNYITAFRINRRSITFLSLGILCLAGLVLIPQFITKQGFWAKAGTSESSINNKQPQYTTVTPSGKDIQDLGGWKRVSPQDRNPVFAFADKIGDVPINVSQQPLPDSFKSAKDEKVKEVALGFNASDKIVADGTTIYIGSSSDGPQSVIASKGDLLILIKSTSKIENNAWGEYIKSLN
jgi:hypothetical protein